MTNVLVVDDSPVDRKLVGGLIERDGDSNAWFADNGRTALEMVTREAPDVVLVDLLMPGMDGLELVEKIRADFPRVPTILMTSRGNEEIAVRALRKGAASYVPKRKLAEQLIETIRNVVKLSDQALSEKRLMAYMTENTCKFVLENDFTLIALLVGHLQDMLARLRFCDETERMRVGVALDEAIVNAVFHGNLEISSNLRETSGDEFHELARQRCLEPPYAERRLFVEASVGAEKAVFVIRDEGPGFDPTNLPDPTDPANIENVSGRGILLMRTFMDEVTYDRSGNCVTMVKSRSPQQS